MKIVANMSLPAVDRSNDDHWNAARLCQNGIYHNIANRKCNKTVNSEFWFSKLCHRYFFIECIPKIFCCFYLAAFSVGKPQFFCRCHFWGVICKTELSVFRISDKNLSLPKCVLKEFWRKILKTDNFVLQIDQNLMFALFKIFWCLNLFKNYKL